MDSSERGRFADWLFDQLAERDWSHRSFARRIGVGSSAVSYWVSGRSLPDPPNCLKIAEILGFDPDFVLDLAGHRPDSRKDEIDLSDPLISISAANADKLTDEQKRIIGDLIRSMAREGKLDR